MKPLDRFLDKNGLALNRSVKYLVLSSDHRGFSPNDRIYWNGCWMCEHLDDTEDVVAYPTMLMITLIVDPEYIGD